MITHNTRIKVTHDEQQTWSLIIKQVQEKDRGCYMCQINTAQMKKQIGCLEVEGKKWIFLFSICFHRSYSSVNRGILHFNIWLLVSPDIIAEETSSDTTVKEWEDAKLTCKATGNPKPQIIWRREDQKPWMEKHGKSKQQSMWYRMSSAYCNFLSIYINEDRLQFLMILQ